MPLIIAIVLLILDHFQIQREEHRLSAPLGAEYSTYLRAVPRFFPSFREYSEPEEVTISPRLLKRGLFGIAFLLLLKLVYWNYFAGLHEFGMLPGYFASIDVAHPLSYRHAHAIYKRTPKLSVESTPAKK